MRNNDINKSCVYTHIFMVNDYYKDNVIVKKCITLFYILCQLANSIITEKRICFKIFTDLHNKVTEMVYIDTY